ncbi:peptide ABC transporter substrate-binding protein, partial [Fibrobacterota bacterium]
IQNMGVFPLIKIILSFVFISSLFGCQKSAPSVKKVLRLANGAEPQSIDPHKCTGHPGIRIIGALFEGLVSRSQNQVGVEPGLAKSWNISDDGRTYVFHLRESRWSDGKILTAYDFERSWKRFLDPATGAEYSSLLNIIHNGAQVINGIFPADSLDVSAENDSTFRVRLENPTGYFLQLCAFEPLFPVPTHIIETYRGKWTSPQHIISNGPFLLTQWTPHKIMVLNKNPQYWDKDSINLETVAINPIDVQETAYKMFINGELDWIFSIPLSKITAAKKRPEYFSFTQYGVYYYSLNVTRPELNNPFLRKALAYAIDREKIVRLVTRGGEKPATGFVPILASVPYEGVKLNLHNPELARTFLKKARYGSKIPVPKLELLYNTSEGHKKIAEVVGQMWKETLGIEVELSNMEWKIFLQKTKNLQHMVARTSWIADYPDPYSFLELAVSTNGNNRTGYSNPVYDKCLENSQSIQEKDPRYAQLLKCEKILLDDMPVIPIYYYANNEMRNPGIKGAVPNPMGMYSWKKIYLE